MAKAKKENKKGQIGIPWLTFIISLALAISFTALSTDGILTSSQSIEKYQLSVDSLHNMIFYVFQHSGYSHLVGNIVVILAAGVTVERTLRKSDIMALFFGASVFAGLLFAFLNPKYSIIGASAGGISLLTAAFTLDPKKILIGFALAMAIGYVLIFGIDYQVTAQKSQIQLEAKDLESARQAAIGSNDPELAKDTEGKISERMQALEKINEGEKLRDTQPSFEIHLFASIFAFVYLALFRKSEVFKSLRTKWRPVFRLLRIG